jgi:hypothetical protein
LIPPLDSGLLRGECALDPRYQGRKIDGLMNNRPQRSRSREPVRLVGCESRNQQSFHIVPNLSHLLEQFDAGHARQFEIQQNQTIWAALSRQIARLENRRD